MANPLADPKLNLRTLRAIVSEIAALKAGAYIKQGNGIAIIPSKEGIVISQAAAGRKQSKEAA